MKQYLKICLYSCLLLQVALAEGMLDDVMMTDMEPSVPLTEAEQEEAPKINWLPIWEELEVHEEKHHHESVQHVPVDIPVHASITVGEHHRNMDKCAASNGLGLNNLLKQAKALLPLQQIKSIILAGISDPEVQALKRLVTSDEFRAMSSALRNSPEFATMRTYSCDVLHLDLQYYAEFLRAIFQPMLNFSDLPQLASVKASSGGIRGLLQSIRYILPVQELRDLYQGLLASDKSLSDAIAQMKSKENRQILLDVFNRPEYKETRKMLANVGVPLDDMRALVATAMGFQGQMIGDIMGVLL